MNKPKSITQLSKEQLEDLCLNLMHIDNEKAKIIKQLEEQLEEGVCLNIGDYINGDKITNITKDMFIKGQIDIFTDKTIVMDFGDKEVVGYRIRKGGSNENSK